MNDLLCVHATRPLFTPSVHTLCSQRFEGDRLVIDRFAPNECVCFLISGTVELRLSGAVVGKGGRRALDYHAFLLTILFTRAISVCMPICSHFSSHLLLSTAAVTSYTRWTTSNPACYLTTCE